MRSQVIHDEIQAERNRQERKWGQQDHENLKWSAILQEEVGEVAKAILEEPSFECGYDEALRREVIQVAAVAVAWLEAIARQQGELHDGT